MTSVELNETRRFGSAIARRRRDAEREAVFRDEAPRPPDRAGAGRDGAANGSETEKPNAVTNTTRGDMRDRFGETRRATAR